jgi:hypothetical protein
MSLAELSRTEFLEWAKARALQYAEIGDIGNALASLSSDLQKHPETKNHIGIELGHELILNGHLRTIQEMRDFIEGFN